MGSKATLTYIVIISIIFSCNVVISVDKEIRSHAQMLLGDSERISCSFSFDFPSFDEKTVYDKAYTSINLPGCAMLGRNAGEPAMPVKFIKVLLPPAKSVKNIEVFGLHLEIFPPEMDLIEKPIIPYQNPLPFGSKPSGVCAFNNERYTSMDNYPSNLYGEENIGYCRGYTILSLALNPLQYVPGLGRLTFYPELHVNIDLEDSEYINSFYRNNKEDEEWVENLVCNPEMMNRYGIANCPIFDYSGGLCNSSDEHDYVIITTTQNNLNHWETNSTTPYNWTSLMDKHLTDDSLNCTLVTIQDINNCSDYWNDSSLFNDTAAHIREFCKDAYQDWGTSYIFVGGDDEWIPAREMKYAYESGVDSDIYWNHLDNTFNGDGDSYWGEEGDGGFDLYAEMYIGRITCDTPQDVSNWMKKSFYYADSVFTDYLDSAAFYGGDSGWACEGDDFIDFSAIKGTSDWLGPNPDYDGPYPNWLGFQYGFETWNETNPGLEYNLSVKWTAESPNPGWQGGSDSAAINGLKNAINNNQVTLISGIAHAYEHMSLDVYGSTWESDYNNTKPFFLHDYGCHCGDMDAADDGVLHSMLFHSDTELAFACVYNTCYGWGNYYSTNSSSSLQQKCFWDYLFDTTNNSGNTANWQLGKAMAYSKDTMAPTINWDYSYGTWRAIIQGCLLFGDPAQKIKPPALLYHNVGIQALNIDATYIVKSNVSIFVNATVYNNGQNDETNVEVSFRVNSVELNNTTIAFFANQTSQKVSFNWTPSAGSYNVSINISIPSVTEDIYSDNDKNQTVKVGILNINTNELFDTIQEAINDTETLDGHSILVPAGIYLENVSINKNISLAGTDKDTTIIDNNVTSGWTIQIHNRNSVNISQFTIRNGFSSLYINSSSNISITNCNVQNSSGSGISLNLSENVTTTNSNITNHPLGINFIQSSSNNNTITENDIMNNNIGIVVNTGNTHISIYHNNFNNSHNAFDNGTDNIWDNGNLSSYRLRGGNWWSNYTGIDSNGDALGDTPYNISGQNNSQDRYPLIQPWKDPLSGTIYVDDDNTVGPWSGTQNNPFQTIEDGINAASDGDTIIVFNGTYLENVILDKTVTITGENKNTTIIDAGGTGNVVFISANSVNISGFTIQNSGTLTLELIDWHNMTDLDIQNNATAYYGGIYIESSNNKIYNNIITDTFISVFWLTLLSNNNVSYNTIKNSSYGLVSGYSSNIKSIGNNVTNHSYFGIDFGYCSNSIISNNYITDCYGGVEIFDCSNMSLTDNTIYDNNFGIDSPYSNCNIMYKNNITDNYYGIYIYDATDNLIINNNISNSIYYGIYHDFYSINNDIYHNNFVNNNCNAYDYETNNWNESYPIGGNYWDDYTGSDLDGDGIGDSQYNISGGNNVDYYPLINASPAPIILVDDDFDSNTPGWGVNRFDSIKDGINNASDGNTVFVFSGTYNEYNIAINKSITLMGEEMNTTIIDGLNQDYVILVNNDSIEITGFTIQNSDALSSAIYVESNLTNVHNNLIKDCDYGVEIGTGGGTTYNCNNIGYNIIRNSWIGIWTCESNHSTIFENNISDAQLACIWVEDSLNTKIFNNTLISNDLDFADGISIFGTSANTTVFRNTISNNHQGIYIEDSIFNHIYQNTIENNSKGLYETNGFNNTIYHNNFINNSQQAYDDSNNTWYNTTLLNGNYWDDFDESSEGAYDNDSDGIIDSAYNISGDGNQDEYPLVYQFENYYILSIIANSQVNEETQFTVTVKTDGGTTTQGASVIFNSNIQTTNSNGQVTFTAPSVSSDTDYQITASKAGYTRDFTTITVKNVESVIPPGGGGIPGDGVETAPDKPIISGPTEGYLNVSYGYAAVTTDPNDHSLRYYFSWGDGTNSGWTSPPVDPGVLIHRYHIWGSPGAYQVKVKAQDANDQEESNWSEPLVITIIEYIETNPPTKPATPSGPTYGVTNTNYSYSTTATDSDNDQISYRFDWGDGSISDWTSLFDSGATITVSHKWTTFGNYSIRAQARDSNSRTSLWSDPLNVNIDLDSDGDGWSDKIEESYRTNFTNSDDYPSDADGDGILDDDSPDGIYSGDADDDNDGLEDETEEMLGSNSKDKSDVTSIDIDGKTNYLVDIDGDGQSDIFYNPDTATDTTLGVRDDGKYLIDVDGDGEWEYIYDPASKSVTSYEEKSTEEFTWLLVIIGTIIAGIMTTIILFKSIRKKRLEGEKPKPMHYDDKRVYIYTHPKGAEGGIFSKTYVKIDENTVLYLRTPMIPPGDH